MNVLMLYYTKTGHTLEAVNAVANGIRATGSMVDLVSAQEFAGEVDEYDALIVGCPCWGGIAGAGVAIPIDRALAKLGPGALAGKQCGAVSVHSGTGAESAVKNLGNILSKKGCEDFFPGPVARAGAPFSLWIGPAVQPEDEERFSAYGSEFCSDRRRRQHIHER